VIRLSKNFDNNNQMLTLSKKPDNINQMITVSKSATHTRYCLMVIWDLINRNINLMIRLSVIPLRSFRCTRKLKGTIILMRNI
jgi:hypothetical protein